MIISELNMDNEYNEDSNKMISQCCDGLFCTSTK